MPFNLRPLDEPLPRELGNRFGLVLPAAPGRDRGPARGAWTRCSAAWTRSRTRPRARSATGCSGCIGLTPAQVEQRLLDLFSRQGHGGDDERARARASRSTSPAPRSRRPGLGADLGQRRDERLIFSYAGEVTVGVMADRGLVPDPGEIVGALGRELQGLLAASP